MKGLRKMFRDGGAERLSLKYWSPDVEASWTIDVEAADSLQIVYERKDSPGGAPDENFWIYLSPQDAAVIGAILTAFAAAHGEKA